MGGQGARAPLTSEIQEIFGNFRTLFQMRMCMMTSWDLNVNVRRKNIKMCPPIESLPTTPLATRIFVHYTGTQEGRKWVFLLRY